MPKTTSNYWIEMTGSPKKHGFKTKQVFFDLVKGFGVNKCGINDCNYLITDNLASNTIKMKTAKKHRATIMTYSGFANMFTIQMRLKKISDLKRKYQNKL